MAVEVVNGRSEAEDDVQNPGDPDELLRKGTRG
jgi:hypothetical protein